MNVSSSFTNRSDHKDFKFVFNSCVVILGILINGFVILMFSLRRKLRTVTNYFVANLAVSDFFLLLQLILYLLAYKFFYQIEIPKKIYSNIVTSFLALGMSASPASLVVVSFDRYYAISEPLRYNSVFTHRRAIFIIIGIWVYAIILYLLNWLQLAHIPYYSKFLLFIYAVGNFIIPLCSVTFFYVRILKIALVHLRDTTNTKGSISETSFRKKQLRIAVNVFALIFPLLVVWSTYYVYILMLSYCPRCASQLDKWKHTLLGTLPQIAAAVNPITYILLTKDFRAIIKSKSGGLRKISKHLKCTLGIHADNFQLSSITYNSECSAGVYRGSSDSPRLQN